MHDQPALKRSLSLPYITFYGLGTILGAGIYVLVGEIVGRAGLFAPISFLIAATTASFTAISYAELSARIPRSAGEAAYMECAFHRRHLTVLMGMLVCYVLINSSATLANGFASYLQLFLPIPQWIIIIVTVILIGLIAAWGIKESAISTMVITVIEISGLVLIIAVAGDSLASLPDRFPDLIPRFEKDTCTGIFMGAFLAFFAFIGFEDMVNVAEEVKNPQKTMPHGIFLAFSSATILYILIALIAVLSLPLTDLAGSETPLATIYHQNTGKDPALITIISLFAIINGVLVQVVAASRILYGLSREGRLPGLFGSVNARTRTPLFSTVFTISVVLVLALWLPLITLAQVSSFVVLIVYVLINISLIKIKVTDPEPEGLRVYPFWIPVTGAFVCASVLLFKTIMLLKIV